MYLMKKCRHGVMLYNKRDIWQGKSFDLYGEFSEKEVELFQYLIKPKDVVFDIGANIGSHTIAFARIVTEGLVVAFEPERYAFYALAGNVAINNLKNVFPFNQALGNNVGSINVPEIDFNTTQNFGGLELDKDYSKVAHYPVTLNKIDAIQPQQVNFIKIDVEGMEKTVLQGAENTIKKFQPILYVENDRKEHENDLIDIIKMHNYTAFIHQPPLFNPNNYFQNPDNHFSDVVSINILAFPKSLNLNLTQFVMQPLLP